MKHGALQSWASEYPTYNATGMLDNIVRHNEHVWLAQKTGEVWYV